MNKRKYKIMQTLQKKNMASKAIGDMVLKRKENASEK
jgi:hypothetical protein